MSQLFFVELEIKPLISQIMEQDEEEETGRGIFRGEQIWLDVIISRKPHCSTAMTSPVLHTH